MNYRTRFKDFRNGRPTYIKDDDPERCFMSHHFDTPTAKEDPRINVCDFYLFRGRPGTTVMALTVNPDAGGATPDTFREEALYAFRFDLNSDAVEEMTFKVKFTHPAHVGGDDHRHAQLFEVRRATGADALNGGAGEVILTGRTEELATADNGVTAFAGLAPDLFAGDAAALHAFQDGLHKDNRFAAEAFLNRKNFFARKNVTAIVLEVPTAMIGKGMVHAWATASLYGHAPEVQVSRWGLPLITHVFMPDPAMREDYNRTTPSNDVVRFGPQIGQIAEKLSRLAGSAANSNDYARQLTARLCPTMLPYELDTPATFNFAGFNGRTLTDDVMDVILTLASDTSLSDGVAPDRTRTRDSFPYFGEPYSAAEKVASIIEK
jgi:hypothetical protein